MEKGLMAGKVRDKVIAHAEKLGWEHASEYEGSQVFTREGVKIISGWKRGYLVYAEVYPASGFRTVMSHTHDSNMVETLMGWFEQTWRLQYTLEEYIRQRDRLQALRDTRASLLRLGKRVGEDLASEVALLTSWIVDVMVPCVACKQDYPFTLPLGNLSSGTPRSGFCGACHAQIEAEVHMAPQPE